MANKEVVIFGAGKLGKGLAADIFHSAGYHLTFLCHSLKQAKPLREAGKYTVFQLLTAGGVREFTIDNYDAYATVEEYDECVNVLATKPLVVAPIYPVALKDLGLLAADAIKKRVADKNEGTLDIIVALNSAGGDKVVKSVIEENLSTDEEKKYFEEKVGIVLGIPNRLGANPTPEMLAKDPNCNCCGESTPFQVDKDSFKGEVPEFPMIMPLSKMNDRIANKLWVMNMKHCLSAYVTKFKGYKNGEKVSHDEEIFQNVMMANSEAEFAFFNTFSITREELNINGTPQKPEDQIRRTLDNLDSLDRIGADPKRKLAYGERLTGPAVACAKLGRVPFFLTKGMACAFLFDVPEDKTAPEIQACIKEKGIGEAIIKYCGLDITIPYEKEVYDLVRYHYYNLTKKIPSVID